MKRLWLSTLLFALTGAGSPNAKTYCVCGMTIGSGWIINSNKDTKDEFTLTDQNGQVFHLSQLRGKVVLLFFGYTHCPDACPTTMSKLTRVYKLLGNKAQNVVTVFVSLDPYRDRPTVLKMYLAYFHLNSVGLTGSKEEIDRVVNQYSARYEIEQSDSAAGYHINHSTDLYLLDKKGEIVNRFKYEDGTQTIADGLRSLFLFCCSHRSILELVRLKSK